VVVVAALAWVTYAIFPASFTLGTAGLTGIIVFLLHAVSPDSVQTALDRGIDTIIGGAIGLTAYALWPTWSAMSIGRLLATVAEAQRAYLRAVLDGLIAGSGPDQAALRPHARAARQAWTDASSVVALARSEPRRGEADPERAASTLGAMRRVVWGVHALRVDAATVEQPRPLPQLAPLGHGLDQALTTVANALRDGARSPLPHLRRLYRELAWPDDDRYARTLEPPLDELIDAVDTVAASIGLEPR
jgi:uncharacterized membrane protein YccC